MLYYHTMVIRYWRDVAWDIQGHTTISSAHSIGMRDDHRVHTYNVKYLLILMINSSPIHELTNDIVIILSATVLHGTVHKHLLHISQKEV
jgi:hypothetical protein